MHQLKNAPAEGAIRHFQPLATDVLVLLQAETATGVAFFHAANHRRYSCIAATPNICRCHLRRFLIHIPHWQKPNDVSWHHPTAINGYRAHFALCAYRKTATVFVTRDITPFEFNNGGKQQSLSSSAWYKHRPRVATWTPLYSGRTFSQTQIARKKETTPPPKKKRPRQRVIQHVQAGCGAET